MTPKWQGVLIRNFCPVYGTRIRNSRHKRNSDIWIRSKVTSVRKRSKYLSEPCIIDAVNGKIVIDGIGVSEFELRELRSELAIITYLYHSSPMRARSPPQFDLRLNNKYSDETRALENLFREASGLEYSENGGWRQHLVRTRITRYNNKAGQSKPRS